jgi:hypothetical protein
MSAEDREVRRCVQMAIDTGLHDFLIALSEAHDSGRDIAVFVDGQNVAEQSDRLAGELFGEQGWLIRHSKHGEPPE